MAEYIKRDVVTKGIMAAEWMDGYDGAMAMEIAASAPAADVASVVRCRRTTTSAPTARGRTVTMPPKIILDLCGGTGSWSRPWQLNGYDVRIITLPAYDVLTYEPPDSVWAYLPPHPAQNLAC